MTAKHTCIIEIADYDYEDLKNAVMANCEMTELFWPQDLEQAVGKIATEFINDLGGKTFDQQLDYTKSYLGWALFIGICMGAGKRARLTRCEKGQVC